CRAPVQHPLVRLAGEAAARQRPAAARSPPLGRAQRARQVDRPLLAERALQPDQQTAVFQEEHVLRNPELPLLEGVAGRAVEEEMRRARHPDRALAVELERLDGRGLTGHLARVLGVQVAAELVDEQAEPGALRLRQAGLRAVL